MFPIIHSAIEMTFFKARSSTLILQGYLSMQYLYYRRSNEFAEKLSVAVIITEK